MQNVVRLRMVDVRAGAEPLDLVKRAELLELLIREPLSPRTETWYAGDAAPLPPDFSAVAGGSLPSTTSEPPSATTSKPRGSVATLKDFDASARRTKISPGTSAAEVLSSRVLEADGVTPTESV